MKKNEKKSLISKSHIQLRQLEADVAREIATLRVKRFTEQNKNTRIAKSLRRKLAVVKTALRASQLGGTL